MLAKYIALAIYLIVLAIITWIAARRKSVSDFLFASHDVSWKPLTISLFSSVISSYNIVVILTFSYIYGPYVLLIFLGVLAAFLGIYFVAKKYKDIISAKGFNNIIDFFTHRFDAKLSNTLNLVFIGVLFLFITLQLFINTSIFSEFLGWNKYLSAIFVGTIVLIYTTIGGLKAEIFTDVFQGILMLLIVALVFMVDLTAINTKTVISILTDKAIIIGAISLSIAQFLSLFFQPEVWQRVAAARNIHHLKKGFIASWILLMIFVIPLILIGVAARSGNMVQNTNTLFYDVFNASAPEWFFPFLIVGLFAAFMSTLDSSLFAISSQLGKYGFLFKSTEPQSTEKPDEDNKIARKTRLSIAVVTVVALTTSLFFVNFLQGVFGLISLLTVISASVLLSIILKLSSNETFLAILVGFAAFIFAFFGGYVTQEAITTLYPVFALLFYILLQTFSVRIYSKLKKNF